MAIKHSNPIRPRIDRDRRKFWARTPYNFVPLPEKVITEPEDELLTHEKYDEKGLTGYIDCTLETCSPTYVRGMMTEEQFENQGRKKSDELTEEEKEARAPFFAVDENDPVDNKPRPVIPGSTLRGMIRSIVEIVGYGRIRWVADKPTFSFRAVAAPSNDPLREPYRQVLGPFGRNVHAGYLEKKGNRWYIRPAKTTKDMGWASNEIYLKVKETDIRQEFRT